MINVFLYSIANHKSQQFVDDLIIKFLDSPFVPEQDKKVLRHCQEVALKGSYPTAEYFSIQYPQPPITYNSVAEISAYCDQCLDFYKTQNLHQSLISAMNDTTSYKELIEKLSNIVSSEESIDVEELPDLKPISYLDTLDRPNDKGIMLGVQEIDTITNGFQPGTVAFLAAFTAHGKSTAMVSLVYKNVMNGHNCLFLSLEMTPELIWMQFQARWLYEVKGLDITSQDLFHHTLPVDVLDKVKEYEPEFQEAFRNKLVIVDESFVSQKLMLDYKSFSRKIRSVEKVMGHLDFLIVDHVGQFELMYDGCGNKIIKQLQSFTKTYINTLGVKVTSIFAIQTNREGEKRARKRDGVYDIQAISDLNEAERTASYIVFMYTSEDMKIVQETKMTLSKHRLGPTLTEPVVTSFNPAVCIVGSNVDKVSINEDEFNDMLGDVDFGDSDFADDEF